MRQKLRGDPRAAIKGRQTLDVAVLRGLIAAVDNAGAVPLAAKSEPPQHEEALGCTSPHGRFLTPVLGAMALKCTTVSRTKSNIASLMHALAGLVGARKPPEAARIGGSSEWQVSG